MNFSDDDVDGDGDDDVQRSIKGESPAEGIKIDERTPGASNILVMRTIASMIIINVICQC